MILILSIYTYLLSTTIQLLQTFQRAKQVIWGDRAFQSYGNNFSIHLGY